MNPETCQQSGQPQRSATRITLSVLLALVLREMRGRFGAHRLGAFWLLFEPIAHVLVMVAIFTLVRGRSIPGVEFPVFLVSGVVPFILMKNIVLRTMEAVSSNKALFSYRQIKPFDTVVARAVVEFFLAACVYLIILFVLGFWGGFDVSIHHPLEWIGTMVVCVMLSFSLGLIFCIVGEAMPEAKTIFRLIFLPLYFISAVVVPIWLIPADVMPWLLWNPFMHVIDEFRSAVFEHYPVIRGINLIYPGTFAAVSLFIGLGLYRARRLKLVAI